MSEQSSLHAHFAVREGWTEVFLTVLPTGPVHQRQECEVLYRELRDFLREHDVEILHQKVLARSTWTELIAEIHDDVLGREGRTPPPFTMVEGNPCRGGELAGIQIVGARIESPEVEVHTLPGEPRSAGVVLETPSYRRCYLAELSGYSPEQERSPSEQTRQMFLRTRDLLVEHDFEYTDVVRTWIYLPRILDWYDDFNRARSACYREFRILGEDALVPLPASTGIQAGRKPGEEVLMDLVAYSLPGGRGDRIVPAHNPRQNEAYEYGSSFSRGMVVDLDGPRTCYVSGTASIDGTGKTVYLDDSQGQVMETYLDIGALLGAQGLGLKDLRHATAYCKRPEDFLAWEEMHRSLQLPWFPVIPVYGDVCRENLLFEMEALAVASVPSQEPSGT